MISYIPLPNRGVVLLEGSNTRNFLQGIITNNIAKLQDKTSIYSLLLSPQGRYLYDFFLIQKGKSIFLECENAHLLELIKKLNLLKTYLKVRVHNISKKYKVGVILNNNNDQFIDIKDGIVFADPRHKLLGIRVILPIANEIKNIKIGNFEEYEQVRIQNLVPNGLQDMIQNKSFPLQFMIDKISGVDFDKGCYIGQEVVARMHRYPLRRRIYLITSECKLPAYGARVTNSKKQDVGEIRSSINNIGIALLNTEDADSTDVLFVDNTEVRVKNLVNIPK